MRRSGMLLGAEMVCQSLAAAQGCDRLALNSELEGKHPS